MNQGLRVLVCEACGLASFFAERVIRDSHRLHVRCPLCGALFPALCSWPAEDEREEEPFAKVEA